MSDTRYRGDEAYERAAEIGRKNPGGEVPLWITNERFPLGSVITYKFRELTRDGYPKEARYHRRRIDE
jgi:hypothetical protein